MTLITQHGMVTFPSVPFLMNIRARIGRLRAKSAIPDGVPYKDGIATLAVSTVSFQSPGPTYAEAVGNLGKLIEEVFE